MNFAVAGSTALPAEVLLSKNIMNVVTKESLSTQLEWMFTYFNTTCSKGNRHVSYDVSIVNHFSTIMPDSYCSQIVLKKLNHLSSWLGRLEAMTITMLSCLTRPLKK